MKKFKILTKNYFKYTFCCILIKLISTILLFYNSQYNIKYSIFFAVFCGIIVGFIFTLWYNYFKNIKFFGNIIISYVVSSIFMHLLLILGYIIFLCVIYF